VEKLVLEQLSSPEKCLDSIQMLDETNFTNLNDKVEKVEPEFVNFENNGDDVNCGFNR